MNRRAAYGPHEHGVDLRSARTKRAPPNPWKAGDRVRYHPIIGEGHDSKVYTVKSIGTLSFQPVAWLEGKAGCVAVEALSRFDDSPQPPTAKELLDEARRAWRDMSDASNEIARLRLYKRLTAGMRDDLERHSKRYDLARSRVTEILEAK